MLTHEGVCRGALVWNAQHGKTFVWAKQTILCSGGTGQIYRETTNPDVATGDGLAMAWRAGAEPRDMEFMQFHPTVLYIAGSSRNLITEAMRGEGAHLVDRHGYRFMPDYDQRAELAPRDVVSRAIVAQMEKTRHPNVYFDLRHLDADRVVRVSRASPRSALSSASTSRSIRFPCDPGPITWSAESRSISSGVPRCPACGPPAKSRPADCTGQSPGFEQPARGLVFGAHAGRGASQAAAEMADDFRAVPLVNRLLVDGGEPLDLADIRNSLKSLMWRAAGVRREGAELAEAAENIDRWCRYALARQFSDPEGWELQNMLTVARIMIAAAFEREETRGVHLRTDFPSPDNHRWQRRIAFQREFFVAQPIQGPAGYVALDRGTIDVVPSRARVIAPPRGYRLPGVRPAAYVSLAGVAGAKIPG